MIAKTGNSFPGHAEEIKIIVDGHRQLKDEPLLLAVYYAPARDQDDIFLFEVLENFGNNQIDPDRNLFEVTYGSSSDLSLAPGQRLHLVMTNPTEFRAALKEGWRLADELRDAKRSGKWKEIYREPQAGDLLESMDE